MLGSEGKLERPEEHMPPRLRRELPSIKVSAEERSESYTDVVYGSTCDTYSSSSCDGATHVLSTLLRTVCTTYSIYSSSCGLIFLRIYSVDHRVTVYSQGYSWLQNNSIIVAGNYPAFVGHQHMSAPHTPPPVPSRITILHLTTDGPDEAFPGQEDEVDRDRRYDDVSS